MAWLRSGLWTRQPVYVARAPFLALAIITGRIIYILRGSTEVAEQSVALGSSHFALCGADRTHGSDR